MAGCSGLSRTLAFLRSRLLGAVSLPALIGAAWAWRAGAFGPGRGGGLGRLLVVLAGLAAVELTNLFGADYLRHLRGPQGPQGPELPGNPVVSPRRLPPEAIPRVLAALAAAGAAALLYFVFTVGPGVLGFLLPAAGVGALYVLSPFPCAFLATALVPPLVAGGTAYVLQGGASAGPFLAALPVVPVSAGVILTYQLAYRRQPPLPLWRRALAVLLPYVLSNVAVAALLLARVYPRTGFFALLPAIVFPGWAARLLFAEPRDPVPATAVGVLLHTSLCLAIAGGLFWG